MQQSQKHLPKSLLLPGQHASLLNNTNALLSFPPCNTPSVFTTSPYLAGQTAGKPTNLCSEKQTSAVLSSNLPAVWKRWEETVVKYVKSRWRLREITLPTGKDFWKGLGFRLNKTTSIDTNSRRAVLATLTITVPVLGRWLGLVLSLLTAGQSNIYRE